MAKKILLLLVLSIICIMYLISLEWDRSTFKWTEKMPSLCSLPDKSYLMSPTPKPSHSRLSFQGTPHADAPQQANILLLSSVGRSGSSFLGELLSYQPSTIYFFEPELYLQMKDNKEIAPNDSQILLQELYQCKFEEDWIRWALMRGNVFRDNFAKEICPKNNTTAFKQCMEDKCSETSTKVIKVIKMRLSWVAEMLAKPEHPLKVIHLVRDPRGSFTSLKKENMFQKDFKIWCPRILEDLELVNAFKALFPEDFLSVRFEDLCFDPLGTATKLWQFISNTKLLPEFWSTYLHQHTTLNGTEHISAYGTVRHTKTVAEAWRKQIDDETLVNIEQHCGDILEILHYTKFGTLENVRNLSIPLIN